MWETLGCTGLLELSSTWVLGCIQERKPNPYIINIISNSLLSWIHHKARTGMLSSTSGSCYDYLIRPGRRFVKLLWVFFLFMEWKPCKTTTSHETNNGNLDNSHESFLNICTRALESLIIYINIIINNPSLLLCMHHKIRPNNTSWLAVNSPSFPPLTWLITLLWVGICLCNMM